MTSTREIDHAIGRLMVTKTTPPFLGNLMLTRGGCPKSLTYLPLHTRDANADGPVQVFRGSTPLVTCANLAAAREYAAAYRLPLKPKKERDWRANFKD